MRALDELLPVDEFSERHRLAKVAPAECIDAPIRAVSLRDIPAPRALWLRRPGPAAGRRAEAAA